MPFNPFPANSEIATYSTQHIPFTVPRGKGYRGGEDIANMDPIIASRETSMEDPLPAYSAMPSTYQPRVSPVPEIRKQGTSPGPKKKVTFAEKPRSSSHGSAFKNAAKALHLYKPSSHSRSNSNPDSQRPVFQKKPNPVEFAISDSDEEINYNDLLAYNNSNQPSFVDPKNMNGFIVYSSNGLYNNFNQQAQQPQPPQQPMQPQRSQMNAFNSHQTGMARRTSSPNRVPSPGYPTHRSSTRPRSSSRSARSAPVVQNMVTSIALFDILKAPVQAVENPELRLVIIVIEGVLLLMMFNWILDIMGCGVYTLVVIIMGFIFLQALFSKSSTLPPIDNGHRARSMRRS